MADIPFPSSPNSPFEDTNEVIKNLVKAQEIPIEGYKDNIKLFEEEKEIWLEIKKKIETLEESSRRLYSFENPFAERIAESDNESIIRASAQRNAEQGTRDVRVITLANKDKFRSKELSKDFEVAAGLYQFQVNEQKIDINFRGGTIGSFASAITARGKKKIKASVVGSRQNSVIFILEAMEEGSENTLKLDGLALDWALDVELLKEAEGAEKTLVKFDPDELTPWEGGPLESYLIDTQSTQKMVLEPYARFSISVPPPKKKDRMLEFSVTSEELTTTYYKDPDIDNLVNTTKSGLFKRRTEVDSEANAITEDLTAELAIPETYQTPIVFYAQVAGSSEPIALESIPAGGQKKTINTKKIPADQEIQAILVYNNNPYTRLTLENLQYTDRDVDGYDPVFPISEASDAEIEIDGVPVFRKTNQVSDFIKGVTLDLRRADKDEVVTITVGPDIELISDSIIQFHFDYNEVIAFANIFTSSNDQLIEEIGYWDDDYKDQIKEQQGKNLLRGEMTLVQLKNQMQNITQRSYATISSFSLLASIGVYNNPLQTDGSGAPPPSRRRGYLQIDADILEKSITDDLEGVKNLFGIDTTGNLGVDDGIAFNLYTILRPYTQPRSIISTKENLLDSKIKSENEKIERTQLRVDDYEARTRREFGNMQSAIDALKSQGNSFNSLNNNNNKN